MFQEELDNLAPYRSASPYPKVAVIAKNEYYADILLDNYSGIESAFTLVNQYTYHKNVNLEYDRQIAHHLGQIARVETGHLGILAQLICKLGAYPVYHSSDRSDLGYWSGLYVGYGRGILEQLQNDLDLEYQMIKNYNTSIHLIKDPNIQSVLQRLVEDEEVHVEWLERMIRNYY